jgi:sulfur-oxidizing protein SoxZ
MIRVAFNPTFFHFGPLISMIKIRSKPQGAHTLVRLLIDHPMETGRRRDEVTGILAPAHFITELRVELNGQPVISGLLSTAVSKNPYFSFRLNRAKPGDLIRVTWVDNLGQQDSAEARIGSATD